MNLRVNRNQKKKVGEETAITVNRQIYIKYLHCDHAQTALRHIAQHHQCFQNSPVVQLLHQEEELQAARKQSLFKTLQLQMCSGPTQQWQKRTRLLPSQILRRTTGDHQQLCCWIHQHGTSSAGHTVPSALSTHSMETTSLAAAGQLNLNLDSPAKQGRRKRSVHLYLSFAKRYASGNQFWVETSRTWGKTIFSWTNFDFTSNHTKWSTVGATATPKESTHSGLTFHKVTNSLYTGVR